MYAVGKGFAVVVFGKVKVCANISETVNGWDFEALVVPNVVSEKLARDLVASEAETLVVGDLCPNVLEKDTALPHCVDVAGLMSKASCDDEQVVRKASWFDLKAPHHVHPRLDQESDHAHGERATLWK